MRHPDNTGGANLLRFANGDLATLTWSAFHNDSTPIEQVSVTHPTGRLVADDGRLLKFYRTPPSRKHFVTELSFADADALLFEPTYSIPYGQNTQLYRRGYVPELEEFTSCVRTGGIPVSGVDDAEATLLIRQAFTQSVERGGTWVDVEKGAWQFRRGFSIGTAVGLTEAAFPVSAGAGGAGCLVRGFALPVG